MKKTTLLRYTKDDWYPNYPDNQVKLIYVGLLSNGKYRVLVRGADDCGLEQDFIKRSDSINMFKQLSKLKYINKEDLIKLKFIYI